MATISRRDLLRFSAAGVAGLALAGCGGASQTAARATAGASGGEKPKETALIQVAVQGGGLSNDPARTDNIADWVVIQSIYNGLLRYKPGGHELQGDLAESWDVSKDGLQYTFKLRKGVEFHKGFGEFTSDDVKFTYERHNDPSTKSVMKAFLSMIASVEAVDKYTVGFKLKQPFAPFLSVLALGRQGTGIVSKAAAAKLGNDTYSDHPIGTGPFVFDSSVPNQSRTLTRNDSYFEGAAYTKQLKLVNLNDQATLGAAIEKGEINIANILGADIYTKFKSSKDVQFFVGESFDAVGAMLNTRKPPFDKVEVRQALALAINQKELIDGTLAGIGSTINASFLLPGMVGYDDTIQPPSYDPDKAKSMLAAAGVSNLKLSLPVYTGTLWGTAGALLKEQFRAIGVDFSAPQLEFGALTQRRRDDTSDGTLIALTTGPDPDAMMRYYTSAQLPPGNNFSRYTGVDDLVDASEKALTDADRVAAIKKFQRKLADDMPELPLFREQETVGASKNFRGYQLDPLNGFWLYRAWLA